jgi:hypothetical protein
MLSVAVTAVLNLKFHKGCTDVKPGGAEEDRTPDLRVANATLSQLSYRPISTDSID